MKTLPQAVAAASSVIELSGSGSARTGVGSSIKVDEAGQNAKETALQRSIVVQAICRNSWPRSPVSIGKMASQLLLQNLLEFGVHARRYLELTRQPLILGQPYWSASDLALQGTLSSDGWEVINKVIHHREISLVAWTNPDAIDWCVFSHVKVTSDRGTVTFCADALVTAFTNLVTALSDLETV